MIERTVLNVSTGESVVCEDAREIVSNAEREADSRPARQKRARGHLVLRDDGLYSRSDEQLLARSMNENKYLIADIKVSPDGHWAVIQRADERNAYLIEGETSRKTPLHAGGGWDFAWFVPGVVEEKHIERAARSSYVSSTRYEAGPAARR